MRPFIYHEQKMIRWHQFVDQFFEDPEISTEALVENTPIGIFPMRLDDEVAVPDLPAHPTPRSGGGSAAAV